MRACVCVCLCVCSGVRDMVRVSDARMSGTAYGTVVLHVAPESAAGGPLALVKTGDVVELDVEARLSALLRLFVACSGARRSFVWCFLAVRVCACLLTNCVTGTQLHLDVRRRTAAAARSGKHRNRRRWLRWLHQMYIDP